MLKKLSFALAAILSVSLLASCVINTSDDDDNDGVDWSSYESSGKYSIILKNNTSTNLVCFKGAPDKDTLMGGVKASARTALAKNSALFTESTDFLLFLVSEDDYNANKGNLKALEKTPFGQVYAYWNKDSANTRVYEISSHMGGNCKLLVNNITPFNVELREGGLYETPIGYVGTMDLEKTFHLETEKYRIYPVFRKFDRKSAEILSQFPKYSDGANVVEIFGFDDETTEIEIDANEWLTNVEFKFSPSASYLEINNTSQIGISLYNGQSTALQTTSGYTTINAGKKRMFDIPMTKTGDGKYKESETVGSYKYGDAAIGKFDIPSKEVKAGYMYTFIVEQEPGQNNKGKLQGHFESDEGVEYSIDEE